MRKRSSQQIRDEAAMAYAGFLGHTFFVIRTNADGTSRVVAECGDLTSSLRHQVAGDRVYEKVGRGKYRLIAIHALNH